MMRITRHDIEQRLSESGIEWHRLELDGGWSVIVSSYGGRLYGPFHGPEAESVNWVPDAFAESETFSALLASRFWNVGGERVWIGPEIRYMIPDRSDYWGSYTMPAGMDPGDHSLHAQTNGVRLSSRFALTSFAAPLGTVMLDVVTSVIVAANPLRQLSDFDARFGGISYAGYTSSVSLTQSSEQAILSESWNLNQVRPGGIALIPTVRWAEVTDYYEAVGNCLERREGGLSIALSGTQRFKIGVKSAQHFGRVGHIRRDEGSGESLTLIVRASINDPSSEYTEEPDFAPGVCGDSVHLYNDDGGLGGFAELEARGRTVGRTAGTTTSNDTFSTWCYRGNVEQLADVAKQLLGMDLPSFSGF
jgi:hypothetical protein